MCLCGMVDRTVSAGMRDLRYLMARIVLKCIWISSVWRRRERVCIRMSG